MPASVFSQMNTNSQLVEDQRALQLAFELSLLGLNGEDENGQITNSGNLSPQSFAEEAAKKRSANMTECVPVPSSEHVAEIVGRQGCKIKALRAKTNTYIKTPVRGEEPVFVVTGRKDDVCMAKREILSAAEHFSQIRASRRNSSVSSITSNGTALTPAGPLSPNAPGQVTIQVRVPYRVVGLVVGPKGATIKRIQQQTHTYIVTPSRDKEPVFEVTGLPENVEKARQDIESHIAMRTGGSLDNHPDDDFHSNGIDSGFHELNGTSDFLNSMYNKSPSGTSNFTAYNNAINGNSLLSHGTESTVFNFPPISGTARLSEVGQLNSFGNWNGFPNIYDNEEGIGSPTFDPTSTSALWSDNLNDNRNSAFVSLFGTTSTTSTVNSHRINSMNGNGIPRISPTSSEMSSSSSAGTSSASHSPPSEHPNARRIHSDALSSAFTPFITLPNDLFSVSSNTTAAISTKGSMSNGLSINASCADSSGLNGVIDSNGLASRRHCIMCSESEVVAALVPCGHNFFCMECASLIVEKPTADRLCPVCQQEPTQAIRIIS